VQDNDEKNKFFLKKEDIKEDSRGRYTWKPRMPRESKSAAKEETHIEKSDSVGILSNDKESTTSVVLQNEIVLSVSQPQDVEDRQAQAQGRRLDAAALQAFKDRCYETSGKTGSYAYVDCVKGLAVVSGVYTGLSCEEACGGRGGASCCSYIGSCTGFTGKGKHPFMYIVVHESCTYLLILFSSSLSTCLVCKDKSCFNFDACRGANIDYVVGSSCNSYGSCEFATIGSVDSGCREDSSSSSSKFSCQAATIGSVVSSCNDYTSCRGAQLSGVDLINSCNADNACKDTKGYGAFEELINCCSDEVNQCFNKDGLDIVVDGCVSVKCALLFVFI